MKQLLAAVTPCSDDTSKADLLSFSSCVDQSRYDEAVGEDAKDITLAMAQTNLARSIFGNLRKIE